ncbi:MAG: phage tail protein [Symplocastrum torsivum CPER-KK1]|jgi:phage tail-like protein|uniref:Phage tail protein n=1 Tax=Symplocastrum torsivum CPER-KK1 TaxID=450513 RepID=A0A951UCV4_9CYAN|nr:phage tail protein [Symplocastrum torsivum CPER-KK1]
MTNSQTHELNYVTANRFYVEIGGSIAASFSECSGLDVQLDKETYFEGGVNDQQRIFLKQAKFSDVTLKRGITDDVIFWQWLEKFLSPDKKERRNVTIIVFNQAGETMQAWTLVGAVPVGWKTPSLQANSSTVAIEELTLAYEGLKVVVKPSGGSATTGLQRDSLGYFSSG